MHSSLILSANIVIKLRYLSFQRNHLFSSVRARKEQEAANLQKTYRLCGFSHPTVNTSLLFIFHQSKLYLPLCVSATDHKSFVVTISMVTMTRSSIHQNKPQRASCRPETLQQTVHELMLQHVIMCMKKPSPFHIIIYIINISYIWY